MDIHSSQWESPKSRHQTVHSDGGPSQPTESTFSLCLHVAEQRDSYLGCNPNPESRVLTLKLASSTSNSCPINKPGEDIHFHDDSTPKCAVLWHWVYLKDNGRSTLNLLQTHKEKPVRPRCTARSSSLSLQRTKLQRKLPRQNRAPC